MARRGRNKTKPKVKIIKVKSTDGKTRSLAKNAVEEINLNGHKENWFTRARKKVAKHIQEHYQAYRWGSISVSILGLLLIIYPFIPEIINRIAPPDATESPYRVENPEEVGIEEVVSDTIPEDNRVVIPKIGVDAKILEGDSLAVLSREEGVWRDPDTKTPENGGNMVISGHRFQYTPPNMVTLYNLDKVEVDDTMIVYWDGKEYDFKVTEIKVVEPTAIEIKDNTPGKTVLTIYTCTPLWSNTHRLVVIGELI